MLLELEYGGRPQQLYIPDRNLLGILAPPPCVPFHEIGTELSRVISAIADFVEPAHRVLVIVNDYTRPTPTAEVVGRLKHILNRKETRYLVALGTHRPPTELELHTLLGRDFAVSHRAQIVLHDCRDRCRLFFLGKTSFGTEVWLNRELVWSDRIIVINSVEPHYFAGYTGGRKSFLPGVAGLQTITHNHNLVLHPASAPFNLTGNPVHEDMEEAARMVSRPVYSIQTVQDRYHQILAIRHGSLQDSFVQACADAYRTYAVPLTQRADIVLSVLRPPYDINFYQSQRAMEFAMGALKSPGIQITVSRCCDGVGDDSFIEVFKNYPDPQKVLRVSGSGIRPGWHKAARLARIMETTELYVVLGIEDAIAKSVCMHPFRTAQKALDAAIASLGPDASVYVIPDAGAVVPVHTPQSDAPTSAS